MTMADVIRDMSDEALANFIVTTSNNPIYDYEETLRFVKKLAVETDIYDEVIE